MAKVWRDELAWREAISEVTKWRLRGVSAETPEERDDCRSRLAVACQRALDEGVPRWRLLEELGFSGYTQLRNLLEKHTPQNYEDENEGDENA